MDMFVVASFVGFFALVLAWLAAPRSGRQTIVAIEPGTVGAD
jgi:hypothetical protein